MKKYIYIITLVSFIFGITSCDKILDTDSDRYVTTDDHDLGSAADSVYSVLGILQGMQNIGERYLMFGEFRGDLLDITDKTLEDVRNLNNFTVDVESDFANPIDYYAIINNCNYFLSKTADPKSVLAREHALVRTIRAWVYLQIAYAWGEVHYYTDPIVTIEDALTDVPTYSIEQLTDALITDLEPYAGSPYPGYGTIYDFTSKQLFIPTYAVLGDLYLLRGASVSDYEKAATYYARLIDEHYGPSFVNPSQNRMGWSLTVMLAQNFEDSWPLDYGWRTASIATSNSELITAIQMATQRSEGIVSSLPDNWYTYTTSNVIEDLWAEQSYVHRVQNIGADDDLYFTYGDTRKQGNFPGTMLVTDGAGNLETYPYFYKLIEAEHFLLYRLPLIYLRYAEAVNRAGKPELAFAVLKYGLCTEVLIDPAKINPSELENKEYILLFTQNKFEYAIDQGIHARGAGDAAYNPNYILCDGDSLYTKSDTIQWVENKIIDELALETSFEGNRFPDLMRFAKRRNDPSFLASRVAAKHTNNRDAIYSLLLEPKNWYLPEKK